MGARSYGRQTSLAVRRTVRTVRGGGVRLRRPGGERSAARDRGAATVLVSHDIRLLVSLCDRLLFLGEDVIDGTPDEVLARLRDVGAEAFAPGYWEGEGGGER